MGNLATDTVNKVNGPVRDFKSKMPDEGSRLDDLQKKMHETEQKVGSVLSDTIGKAAKYQKVSEDYVKQNPVKGVALAATVGAVIGSLLTLVMRKRN